VFSGVWRPAAGSHSRAKASGHRPTEPEVAFRDVLRPAEARGPFALTAKGAGRTTGSQPLVNARSDQPCRPVDFTFFPMAAEAQAAGLFFFVLWLSGQPAQTRPGGIWVSAPAFGRNSRQAACGVVLDWVRVCMRAPSCFSKRSCSRRSNDRLHVYRPLHPPRGAAQKPGRLPAPTPFFENGLNFALA